MSSLRIAHFDTERTWRGGQQQVYSLIKGLKEKGHQNYAVVRKGFPLAKRLKELGIELKEVTPFAEWDFITPHYVNRWLIEKKIDVIHAHAPHATSLAAISSLKTTIPVLTSRRVDFHLKKNMFSRWKYKRASRFIAISEGVKRVLLEDGIAEEKIDIVPSGIDFSRYASIRKAGKAAMGVPEDHLLIGQVAALADHKDQTTFLKAFKILKESHAKVSGVIIGDGELEGPLKKEIDDLGISDSFHMLGYKLNPLDYVASFDFFCLSSKLEGLGTSILDAMALRIPVVATRAGGIPEMILDGASGFLCEPRNPAALAEALSRAIQAKNSMNSLLDLAYQTAQRFDVSHTVEKTLKVYHSVTTS